MERLRQHPRYGLLLAFVVFLSFTLTIGISQYSFGVFTTELEKDFGWSRTQTNTALSFWAMGGLVAIPVGWALDRWGARPVMALCLTCLATSQLLRPFMTELWQFYALSALQFAAMPGAALMSGSRLIGIWFERTRGRAIGMTTMGANFGGIVFSSLTAYLLKHADWETAYTIYGVLFALLVPVVLLVIQERPHEVTHADGTPARQRAASVGVTLREAIRSRHFQLLVFALFFASATYQSVLPQLVPHLENIGITKSTAAAALSVLALFGMAGKVSFGYLCERYPARYVLMLCLALQVIGLTILLVAGNSNAVWIFIPIFGLGFGAYGSVLPILVQDTVGMRHFGTIFGLVNFMTLGSALIGPPLVGASFDSTGSYQTAFIVLCTLFTMAAVVAWFARPLITRTPIPAVAVAVAESV